MAGRIGWTKCGCCGNPEAAVNQTDKGTLSITCHKCQFSAFAKPGTKAKRLIQAALVADPDDEATAKPQPTEPAPPAPPAAATKAPGSGLLIG
jgi:DNA-directed RNA polymerase subunit RPC12/RpoP